MKRQPRSSPRSGKPRRTVSIIGTGSYVPEKILTNADLSRMVDTSDEWITTRTGIKERRIAAKDEYTSDMATKAALAAIEQAGVTRRIGYLSTGGGALLEYLEGRTLPGVAALDDR